MQLKAKTKGQSLILEPENLVGSGGEARVFALPQNPRLVAKVYHKPTPVHEQKLRIMLTNPPGDPMVNRGHISIAWPVDLLQSPTGNQNIVGFLMPSVTGMTSILDFYNPQIRRQKCPLFNYLYLHRTARNLATAVGALHKRGYVIGDINESNILVSDASLVTIVDTDSFQVTDPQTGHIYRCSVGKPEYTPPELQGIMFSQIDRQPQHDLFGLAVLIFQLLMEGFHPFTGLFKGQGDPPSIEDRILAGHFPYRKKWRRPYEPSPLSPDFHILHPSLQGLFIRCFETGHKKPKRRPDAQTWAHALQKAEDALVECSQNSQHLYGEHLRYCPWCERTERLNGRDPFPSVQAIQQGKYLPIKPPQKIAHSPVKSSGSQTKSSPAISIPSVSRFSNTGSGLPRKFSKKWLVALVLLSGGIWFVKNREFSWPQIALPEISWPAFLTFENSVPPQENAVEKTVSPVPLSEPLKTIRERFRELSKPDLSVRERTLLYRKFLDVYREQPEATDYVQKAKNDWEKLAFADLSYAYRKFQVNSEKEAAATLQESARQYLLNQTKNRVVAREAMALAQWHLNRGAHPLKLVIDQGEKLYVKVFVNGEIYTDTKKKGRQASIFLPNYKSTDTVVILAYRDDRFEDTLLDQRVLINSFKGNHPLKIEHKKGTVLIQVVFDDFPGQPKLFK